VLFCAAAPFFHDGKAAKQIWLHVEPTEAAHIARRIDAMEMYVAHDASLEIVLMLTAKILARSRVFSPLVRRSRASLI
jgi:hypothetical protein